MGIIVNSDFVITAYIRILNNAVTSTKEWSFEGSAVDNDHRRVQGVE